MLGFKTYEIQILVWCGLILLGLYWFHKIHTLHKKALDYTKPRKQSWWDAPISKVEEIQIPTVKKKDYTIRTSIYKPEPVKREKQVKLSGYRAKHYDWITYTKRDGSLGYKRWNGSRWDYRDYI